MRLALYADQRYWRQDGIVSAAQPFTLFLNEVSNSTEQTIVIGRLNPEPDRHPYALADGVAFAPLPYYADASRLTGVARAFVGSAAAFWRVAGRVDAVWLLGPSPFAIVFALLALARRRRVVLGVRQDLPTYTRNRRPGRRGVLLIAEALERCYRLLGRGLGVIVVGPDLARNYRAARRLLPITVSLVSQRDIVAPTAALSRSYAGELQILHVGRLDPEKNPLLLADVLARLVERDSRWRLVVCGDGQLRPQLEERLRALGVRERADLRGHVAFDAGLLDLYRRSHAFLHVSWTEGIPQVLFEAFAAGLPVVATAVGGVPESAAGAALLVPPGNADEIVTALETIANDAAARERLIRAGLARVRDCTIEAQSARVAAFIGVTPAPE